MKASTIEREIEIVETIIGQLNQCLAIFYKRKKYKDFKETLKDIQMCKKELHRLMAEKNTVKDIQQGEKVNDAEQKQHRKNVL
jgi:hypothetical protein